MKKLICTVLAALSLAATSTMAVAQTAGQAPVVTPLTQPSGETVSGDNSLIAPGLIFLVGGLFIGGFVAIVAHGVATGPGGGPNQPTSP